MACAVFNHFKESSLRQGKLLFKFPLLVLVSEIKAKAVPAFAQPVSDQRVEWPINE